MHAIKEVAEAQSGIGILVAWTQLSYQNLAYLLRVKHPLQLDKTLDSKTETAHQPNRSVDRDANIIVIDFVNGKTEKIGTD